MPKDLYVIVLKPLAEWPFKHTWAQYYRAPTQHTHAQKKKSFVQSKAVQQITVYCVPRDPVGRAVLPCVSATLDFPSRGCVSYLPYFAYFCFLFFSIKHILYVQ